MLPEDFIQSLRGASGFDEVGFCAEHEVGNPPVSIRINNHKWKEALSDVQVSEKVPWAEDGFYLDKRPVFTLDPWLHAGAYYVQEASSMFIELAVRQVSKCITIQYALDLCAAPGGKSTHLSSCLPQRSVLVSNEVVGARAAILVENMTKWGGASCIITQNDPAEFSRYEGLFDFILVDAPCSGSGLFRRDPALITEWSAGHVVLCSQRQQRILADVLPSLAPGGFLLYSTCSYSSAEDEMILDWLAQTFNLTGIDLEWPDNQYGVVVTSSPVSHLPCYRFYPGRVKGEGFFMALLQKKEEHMPAVHKSFKGKKAETEMPLQLNPFIQTTEPLIFYRHAETLFAMPEEVYKLFLHLHGKLNIRKAGVKIGEIIHGKFNPAHDFALSNLLKRDAFPAIELDKAEALNFLRRENFDIPENIPNGWILMFYKSLPLGFIKNLGNRINNYYPKDWRIRMVEN